MTPPPVNRLAGSRLLGAQALLVGVIVLGFYLVTLAPSLVWGDGGRLQTDAITGGSLYWYFDELASVPTDGWVFERLGIAAWDHPLWVMTGHGLVQLPVATPTYVLNLMAAVPGAATAAVAFLLLRRMTRSPWAASIGAGSLAVSHTFWFHAVTAEVYALHALFMVTLLWLVLSLVRRPNPGLLHGLAFVSGLGLANHAMLVVTIAPLGGFVLIATRKDPSLRSLLSWRRLAIAFLLFVIGLAPWWIQFLRMVDVAGFRTTATIAAGFPWLGDRWPGPLGNILGNLATYLGFLTYQFTPFGVAAGLYGAARLRRQRADVATLLFVLFVLHAGFSANYGVADRFAFHLPSYVIFALFIGSGVGGFLEAAVKGYQVVGRIAVASLVLVALPVSVYSSVSWMAEMTGLTDADLGIPAVGVGNRDGISYYLNPNQRNDDSAERFGRGALEGLPSNALVLTAWPMDLEAYVAMRHYQLTEDLRPDVTLELMIFTGLPLHESVSSITRAQSGCRPMFLASLNRDAYPIDTLETDFEVAADRYLYRLEPRSHHQGDCAAYTPAQATLDDLIEGVRR